MESATPTAAPPLTEKKSWFETVVISTPVLLTVVATFLVGRATGEMTQAQYYRAVASQDQSKVGDQWAFFQAKRIRSQILEGNADLLLAQKGDRFSRDSLLIAAQDMVRELRSAAKERKATEMPDSVPPEQIEIAQEFSNMATALQFLVTKAKNSLILTKAALNPPPGGWHGERTLLTTANVQAALEKLQPGSTKKSSETKDAKSPNEAPATADPEQLALLKDVISDVKQRRSESEIAPKVLQLKEEVLIHAIKDAESRADAFYQRGKSVENVLLEFDVLVEMQAALAFEYQQIAARLRPLIYKELDSPDNKSPLHPALVQHHDGLERRAEAIRALNARLQASYKAARHGYSARRYEDDARSNQDSAELYEVKVRLSSARSDKHLYRSKMFLFAMLIAQAGVTIATLALAVKRRSLFWLLAAMAGLIAIGFGLYVYLDFEVIPVF